MRKFSEVWPQFYMENEEFGESRDSDIAARNRTQALKGAVEFLWDRVKALEELEERSKDVWLKEIKVKLENGAKIPKMATNGSCAYDLFSNEAVTISPGCRKLVGTGVSWCMEKGYFGVIKSRSGLASKKEIDVKAGVIDSDYRGEIKVLLKNDRKIDNNENIYNSFIDSGSNFSLKPGDKIAQIIILKHESPKIVVVEDLDDTERGERGFGSTGG